MLMVLLLAGYADLTGSCRATPETMNPGGNNESAVMPQYKPDLGPGSPHGFGPEALWTPGPPSPQNGL